MIMTTDALKKALLLPIVLLAAAACSNSDKATAPPPAAVPQPKSLVTATTSTADLQVPNEGYAYVPGGRRDPFTPIIIKEEKKVGPGTKTPLERFPITEFKLSGIVWGGLGYRAVLEGPDGKGYFVRRGTIIGPNRGVVKEITQNSMIIEEKFKDPTGELNKKEIVIELRKPQEGKP